jgi:hypothetical protein
MGGKKYTLENIIERTKNMYKDENYVYLSIERINKHTYVNYLCEKHGLISQMVSNHLKGCGCKFCGIERRVAKRRMTFDEFVEKAKQVHGEKYKYLKLINKLKERTLIKYSCKKHGIQYQNITNHLLGYGCYKCGGTKKLTDDEIKERLKEKFNGKITYIGNYKGVDDTTTKFKCNICQNEFENSLANVLDMINGCSYCSESIGAKKIKDFFQEEAEAEKWFKDCRDVNPLPYDFYIKKYNLLIEYNGKQHYKPVNWTGNLTEEQMKNNLKKQRHHDWLKRKYAKKNNFNYLVIPYWELNNIDKILKEKING